MDGLPLAAKAAVANGPAADSGGAGAKGAAAKAGSGADGEQRFQSLKSAMGADKDAAAQDGKPGTDGKGADGATYDVDEQREMFMKMLVAQLENQNPMDPMKNKEMTGQLAQFSGVEQQIRTNQFLKQMVQDRPGQQRMDAVSLVGREVWAEGDGARLQAPGESQRFRFRLDHSAPVTARIKDDRGEVVRTLDLGTMDPGAQEASWNGRLASGQPAPAGRYRIEVAMEGEDKPKALTTQLPSTVEEVRFGDGGVELGLGGDRYIGFDQVASVARTASADAGQRTPGAASAPGHPGDARSARGPGATLNSPKGS